jgi:hypothetical protein
MLSTDQTPPTAKQIYAALVDKHGMTRVSYSTVSHYIASRGRIPQPASRDARDPNLEARQAVTHLREVLQAMPPSIVARLQPHLDALELLIEQTPDDTESARHEGRNHA